MVPDEDIPGGYSVDKHQRLCHLKDDAPGLLDTGRMMGCHESPTDDPYACVGWLAHELGPGNNIALRIQALHDLRLRVETIGEQRSLAELVSAVR